MPVQVRLKLAEICPKLPKTGWVVLDSFGQFWAIAQLHTLKSAASHTSVLDKQFVVVRMSYCRCRRLITDARCMLDMTSVGAVCLSVCRLPVGCALPCALHQCQFMPRFYSPVPLWWRPQTGTPMTRHRLPTSECSLIQQLMICCDHSFSTSSQNAFPSMLFVSFATGPQGKPNKLSYCTLSIFSLNIDQFLQFLPVDFVKRTCSPQPHLLCRYTTLQNKYPKTNNIIQPLAVTSSVIYANLKKWYRPNCFISQISNALEFSTY